MSDRQQCDAENCGGAWHYEERDGEMVAVEPCPVNNPEYVDAAERRARKRQGRKPKGEAKETPLKERRLWWTE